MKNIFNKYLMQPPATQVMLLKIIFLITGSWETMHPTPTDGGDNSMKFTNLPNSFSDCKGIFAKLGLITWTFTFPFSMSITPPIAIFMHITNNKNKWIFKNS